MTPVSVVIPAFNAEKFLAYSIESILNQSFFSFELIMIDDCSSDSTWQIMQKYKSIDNRIKIYRNSVNLGIAGNRNKGVSLSKSKYLVWQDADDISLPYRIEDQFYFMESNPDVGIVGGYLEVFNEKKVLGIREYPQEDFALRKYIFRYSPIAQPAAMIRISALKQVGDYNLKHPPAEDLDMTFRIGLYYKLANINKVIIKYRQSDTSATFARLRKIELSTLEIRKIYANTEGYSMNFIDKLYNFLHYLSIWIIPAKVKISLFNYFRNRKSQ